MHNVCSSQHPETIIVWRDMRSKDVVSMRHILAERGKNNFINLIFKLHFYWRLSFDIRIAFEFFVFRISLDTFLLKYIFVLIDPDWVYGGKTFILMKILCLQNFNIPSSSNLVFIFQVHSHQITPTNPCNNLNHSFIYLKENKRNKKNWHKKHGEIKREYNSDVMSKVQIIMKKKKRSANKTKNR